MATIVTLTANPLLDHLAEARIAPGRIARVEAFTPVAGGKGTNMGRVLARHGHRVIAAGFAGGESGRQFADLIAADGLEPALTPTAARTRIGFICLDQGDARGNTSVMEGGFAVTSEELGALVTQMRRLVIGADLCLVGGSVPDPSCAPLYRLVLEVCHQAGVPCWIDAYGPAMDQALAAAHPPELAKPNREEYGADGRPWLACRELHLSDGPREVHVRHPQGRFRVAPPTLEECNPVGSGDCYLAALAHARLAGWPLAEQLRYAAAAGAANAARADVARIGPADIEPWRERVTITPAPE
jgi:fructose-1-phosphate kinase PfkB-like protein